MNVVRNYVLYVLLNVLEVQTEKDIRYFYTFLNTFYRIYMSANPNA